ncbi:MAG: sulfatase-like hydrolase/transferase [Pseudomonadota bacterium]|nr:sulfatase-like hydrolase/transferase [Pseudomonadota bacterium]
MRSAATGVAACLALGLWLWAMSWSFGQIGGIADYPSVLRFEVPYLLVLFLGLTYLLRPGPWRALIAAGPIVAIYLAMDVHYVLLHNIFKLDDILLIPEGLAVASDWVLAAVGIAVIGWLAAFVYQLKRRGRELAAPLTLLAVAAAPPAAAYLSPARFLDAAQLAGFSIIDWSDRYTAAVMGRSASLLLFAATKQKALDELALQPILSDPSRDSGLIERSLETKRNVHILVLESLLDPVRFSAVDFRSPADPPRFESLRKTMRVATAPVFGGGTAQVEFEVLCGVPSLELYSPAEFSMMSGALTPCLPTLLAGAGYRTIATQSYKPDFFNSEKAYKSLGFQEIHFPSVYAGARGTYLQYELPDSYIFDGDLLEQNLAYVKRQIVGGQPILNYVLGIYGHQPHEIDASRHPDAVEIEGVDPDSQAYRAIQQFYYRAGALADYVHALRQIDPEGLILVTSDHLPPLDAGPETYKTLGYQLGAQNEYYDNIWFFDGPLAPDRAWPDRQYEFMDFVLDALTAGRYCLQAQCKNRVAWDPVRLTSSYTQLIALGAGAAVPLRAGTLPGLSPSTAATSMPGTLEPGI